MEIISAMNLRLGMSACCRSTSFQSFLTRIGIFRDKRCKTGTGFASCGIAVQTEKYFLNVLAFREEAFQSPAGNAAQGDIAYRLPLLRIKADKGQQVN